MFGTSRRFFGQSVNNESNETNDNNDCNEQFASLTRAIYACREQNSGKAKYVNRDITADFALLKRMQNQDPSLKSLALSEIPFNNGKDYVQWAKYIETLMKNMPDINSMRFFNCNFNEESITPFARALQNGKNITQFSLRSSDIDPQALKTLMSAIAKHDSVQLLYFFSNHIGDNGIQKVAEALETNKSLLGMNIGNNDCTDEAARYLADALMKNKSLRVLDLGYSKITDKGADLFINLLKENKNTIITHIYFSQETPVSEGKRKNLNSLLEENKKLQIQAMQAQGAKIIEKGNLWKCDREAFEQTLDNIKADLRSVGHVGKNYLSTMDDWQAAINALSALSKQREQAAEPMEVDYPPESTSSDEECTSDSMEIDFLSDLEEDPSSFLSCRLS